MEAKYEIDMQTSYLILEGKKDSSKSYMSKMILSNNIPGLLLTELRCIDNKECFYYNISLKQSLDNIYENQLIGYLQLKNLLTDIIGSLENSSKYLLEEEGFILSPKYIYINQNNQKPYLCYYVGYGKPLIEQFSKLIEYFLNKVDYKDEEAVLLVYAIYKEIKESNITFKKLKIELNKEFNKEQRAIIPSNNSKENKHKEESAKIINSDQLSPQVFEVQNTKKEKEEYKESQGSNKLKSDKKSFVLAIISFLVVIIIFLLALQLKLLHNSFKTKIDMVKVMCLLTILICIEGLVMSTIFNKENKASDMTRNDKDIDSSPNEMEAISNLTINNEVYYLQGETYNIVTNNTDRVNVYIDVSPFVIGKNSRGVNYKIDDDTVSRFHAKIEVLDKTVLLTDLGSTNGTYVNDKKIEEHLPYKLRINDNVRFSRCKFVLKCSVY